MSSSSRPRVLVETFPLPLSLACHLASFEVLNLRVNITHVTPSSLFPLVLLSFQAPIIYLYTEVLNGLHLGSSKTEPETRIWVEIIYLRGNPRRPWLLSWGVKQGMLSSTAGHGSYIPLGNSGRQNGTYLRVVPTDRQDSCGIYPPTAPIMAALRGKNSLALPAWAVLGWDAARQNTEGHLSSVRSGECRGDTGRAPRAPIALPPFFALSPHRGQR